MCETNWDLVDQSFVDVLGEGYITMDLETFISTSPNEDVFKKKKMFAVTVVSYDLVSTIGIKVHRLNLYKQQGGLKILIQDKYLEKTVKQEIKNNIETNNMHISFKFFDTAKEAVAEQTRIFNKTKKSRHVKWRTIFNPDNSKFYFNSEFFITDDFSMRSMEMKMVTVTDTVTGTSMTYGEITKKHTANFIHSAFRTGRYKVKKS